MSEFRDGKEPLIWRMAESLAISILIVIALVVGLGQLIFESIKAWWVNK